MTQEKPSGIRFIQKKNFWQARIKVNGKELSACFPSLDEAARWRAAQEARRDHYHEDIGVVHDSASHSFEEIAKLWLEDPSAYKNFQTRRLVTSHMKVHCLDWFGTKDVKAISRSDLMNFANHLFSTPKERVYGQKRRSIKTVKNVMGTLSSFFSWCRKREYIVKDPTSDSDFRDWFRDSFKEQNGQCGMAARVKKKALTANDAAILISGVYGHNDEDGVALECLIHASLRLGELAALTWSDLQERDAFGRKYLAPVLSIHRTRDIHSNRVQDSPKCGSFGEVELNSDLRKAIFQWRATAEQRGYSTADNAPMFPTVERNPRAFSERIARRCKTLGIKVGRAHSMRHTSITMQILAGKSFTEVQKVARHKSARMTEAYFDATQQPTHGVTEGVVTMLNLARGTLEIARSSSGNVFPLRKREGL
jgi:integrase